MKLFRPICNVVATGVLILVLASPAMSFAQDQEHHGRQGWPIGPGEHAQWVKKHLDKEAAMLEIKASQETAWKAYSAAALELLTTVGERKPLPADVDAATIARQRADKASIVAQNLAKLADATEKLQSVLDENQRKVLDRVVRQHGRFAGRHHHQDR
jgi:hypothetical protein